MIEMHKFRVDKLYSSDLIETKLPMPLEVIKQLPHNGREYEYRIKSAHEEHVRGATEGQLTGM